MGHRVGLWNYWYENGVKSVEANYNKILQGKYKDWHDNGEKELIVIISKVKYTVPGTLGIRMEIKRVWAYIKRIKRIWWYYWHDNGQKSSEENYLQGKRDGALKVTEMKKNMKVVS